MVILKFFDAILNSGIIQSFRMAIKSILSNKMRSFLTMLGIIIGVIALVVLVSIVNGGTSSITSTIQSMGNNMVYVQFSDDVPQNVASEDKHEEWLAKNPSFQSIGMEYSRLQETFFGDEGEMVNLTGVTPEYFGIRGKNLLMGRFLKNVDCDNSTYVCVISEKMAKDVVGYYDCIGEKITIGGIDYEVVGVLDDDETGLENMFSFGYPVYVPYGIVSDSSVEGFVNSCTLYLSPAEGYSVKDVTTQAEEFFKQEYPDNEFEVYDISYIEDAMGNITSVLSIVLGAIAGISLLVGGIGIMNIMLVTVTERTREIGIRKAIGASRGVILRQFLFESVVICLIGCGIGIFMSWLLLKIGSLITASLGVAFGMDPTIVILAVSFCFVIGILFGLYPANKAAKMKPIDALHYGG